MATRQIEQREAAAILAGAGAANSASGDASDVTFLDWVDGELEAGMEQRRQVCRVIRTVRPEVVLGHDPWRRYRLHPDHRNAGWLLTDGVVAARDPKFFPELSEAPHRPRSMLLWEADEPNHVENAEGMLGDQGGRPAGPPEPVPVNDGDRRARDGVGRRARRPSGEPWQEAAGRSRPTGVD